MVLRTASGAMHRHLNNNTPVNSTCRDREAQSPVAAAAKRCGDESDVACEICLKIAWSLVAALVCDESIRLGLAAFSGVTH